MSYAQQRDPSQNFVGIVLVVVLHIFIVYALVNGLARKALDIIKSPLEVSVIQEDIPKPPPPPPPPKIVKVVPITTNVPPPPVYVPPPEVNVQPSPQPPLVTTNEVPLPVPQPAPAVVVEEPVKINVNVACPNIAEVKSNIVFPDKALRMGLSGEVLVEFNLASDGSVSNISVVKSSNQIFNSVATGAVSKLRCIGQTRNGKVLVPFTFKLDS